jgi:asparagine N-glycosylation enzyme membrane subunit Stt3
MKGTDQMSRNPAWIRVLLWVGVALFLLCFLGSTIVPDQVLPALGFSGYHGLIIRLYGIFQLSWAFLFFFALKDVEKNRTIIDTAIITGALVAVFFVVYQFAVIRSGWHLLLNAALLLIYASLLFVCKPKPARPQKSSRQKSES